MGFEENRRLVVGEISASLGMINPAQFDAFLGELLKKRRILAAAVGRVLISMKAWVKRLCHLDLDINFVGGETEGPLGEGDLLIAASSSGESVFPVEAARIAKERGASVVYIGCSPESAAARLADTMLILPGRTKLAKSGEFKSAQPMSTLFEQELYLLGDIITLCIMETRGLDEGSVKKRHANLE